MSAPEHLDLAAGFDLPTVDQWRELVADALAASGRAVPDSRPELALATTTYDDITVAPLYTTADPAPPPGLPGLAPYVRGSRPQGAVETGWDVRTGYGGTDAAAVNEEILADLDGGAHSVWLRAGDGGVPVADLGAALDGVLLDLAPVALSAGDAYHAAADALLARYAEQGVPDSEVRAVLGVDPLGDAAATGAADGLAGAAEFVAGLAARYPAARAMSVDATPYHDAGGSDAQELGFSMATGVAYLRALSGAGMDAERAAAQLEFRYATTADQFGTIAKLRAARRLWARVCEVAGIADGGQVQHAVTSEPMMTARDPWVNMLRTTVAAFSAGIGGADAVTVRPFDVRLGHSDAFARRIARNTHAILVEESHLAGVIDPAGGSYYVERVTDELAHRAWEVFTAVERAGGMAAALASGDVAERVERTWQRRAEAIADRSDPITGVSEYPDLEEQPPRRDPAPAAAQTGGLPRRHYAEEYEALRDRADAHPQRPTVWLATLGPLAAHTARAGFAANLYAAGGVAVTEAGPTGSADEVLAACGGAPVVCVCGTESAYTEQLDEVVVGLRAAGARFVALAGKPREGADVDQYLYAGCDALAVLRETLDQLEVG